MRFAIPRLLSHASRQTWQRSAWQRGAVRPTIRWASTARDPPPSGNGNLSSLAYHFKRQKHMPYFLEYLMWVVFGSEALQLIWLKMDYKEYQEKTEHKIKLLEEIIDRIEKGQEFNDDLREEIRMVLLGGRKNDDEEEIDDDYLNKLIASNEAPQRPAAEQQQQPEKPNWPPTQETNGEKKKFFL